jgi:copper(I)-binding protein
MADGKMQMRPKAGGFTVPARGTHELKPGGDHIMFLELTGPVRPGADVAITLTLSDGSTVAFTAVGKEFAGGNESYAPGSGMPMEGSPSPMGMG